LRPRLRLPEKWGLLNDLELSRASLASRPLRRPACDKHMLNPHEHAAVNQNPSSLPRCDGSQQLQSVQEPSSDLPVHNNPRLLNPLSYYLRLADSQLRRLLDISLPRWAIRVQWNNTRRLWRVFQPTAVKAYYERKEKFRIYHGSTNSTRPSTLKRNLVDTSTLSHVLKVDTEKRTWWSRTFLWIDLWRKLSSTVLSHQ
jgi:hypothetical protein